MTASAVRPLLKQAARLLVVLCLGSALWSCAGPAGVEPTAAPPTASPTPAPTPTPTPMPHLVLIAPGDPPAAGGLQQPLGEWAAGRGWGLLLTDPETAAGALNDPLIEPRAVVSLGLPIELNPGVPTVLVEVEGAAPAAVVSTVGRPGARYDQAGFLAGVMAGLTTETEWVGQVTGTAPGQAADPLEASTLAGFDQGLKFGCPRCRLVSLRLAEAGVDAFRGQGVDVVYVPSAPEAEPLAAALAEAGLWLVWIGELPGSQTADVDTQTADTATRTAGASELTLSTLAGRVTFERQRLLLEALEALVGGLEGQAWPYSIQNGGLVLTDINPEAISPGRQRLLNEAYQAVASGELAIGLNSP